MVYESIRNIGKKALYGVLGAVGTAVLTGAIMTADITNAYAQDIKSPAEAGQVFSRSDLENKLTADASPEIPVVDYNAQTEQDNKYIINLKENNIKNGTELVKHLFNQGYITDQDDRKVIDSNRGAAYLAIFRDLLENDFISWEETFDATEALEKINSKGYELRKDSQRGYFVEKVDINPEEIKDTTKVAAPSPKPKDSDKPIVEQKPSSEQKIEQLEIYKSQNTDTSTATNTTTYSMAEKKEPKTAYISGSDPKDDNNDYIIDLTKERIPTGSHLVKHLAQKGYITDQTVLDAIKKNSGAVYYALADQIFSDYKDWKDSYDATEGLAKINNPDSQIVRDPSKGYQLITEEIDKPTLEETISPEISGSESPFSASRLTAQNTKDDITAQETEDAQAHKSKRPFESGVTVEDYLKNKDKPLYQPETQQVSVNETAPEYTIRPIEQILSQDADILSFNSHELDIYIDNLDIIYGDLLTDNQQKGTTYITGITVEDILEITEYKDHGYLVDTSKANRLLEAGYLVRDLSYILDEKTDFFSLNEVERDIWLTNFEIAFLYGESKAAENQEAVIIQEKITREETKPQGQVYTAQNLTKQELKSSHPQKNQTGQEQSSTLDDIVTHDQSRIVSQDSLVTLKPFTPDMPIQYKQMDHTYIQAYTAIIMNDQNIGNHIINQYLNKDTMTEDEELAVLGLQHMMHPDDDTYLAWIKKHEDRFESKHAQYVIQKVKAANFGEIADEALYNDRINQALDVLDALKPLAIAAVFTNHVTLAQAVFSLGFAAYDYITNADYIEPDEKQQLMIYQHALRLNPNHPNADKFRSELEKLSYRELNTFATHPDTGKEAVIERLIEKGDLVGAKDVIENSKLYIGKFMKELDLTGNKFTKLLATFDDELETIARYQEKPVRLASGAGPIEDTEKSRLASIIMGHEISENQGKLASIEGEEYLKRMQNRDMELRMDAFFQDPVVNLLQSVGLAALGGGDISEMVLRGVQIYGAQGISRAIFAPTQLDPLKTEYRNKLVTSLRLAKKDIMKAELRDDIVEEIAKSFAEEGHYEIAKYTVLGGMADENRRADLTHKIEKDRTEFYQEHAEKIAKKDPEKAKAGLESVLEGETSRDERMDTLLQLAEMHMEAGETEKAKSAMDKLDELDPSWWFTLGTYSKIEKALGRG
jgi:hypothetical protein